MSHIIAGRFRTFPAAKDAARVLRTKGFARSKLSVFFVNPAGQHARFPIGGDTYADAGAKYAGNGAFNGALLGAIAGGAAGGIVYLSGVVNAFQFPWLIPVFAAGLGAYIGALAGGLHRTRDPAVGREREGGVMLAVQVDDALTRGTAADVLRASGAENIEDAEGEWSDGEWRDFDPRTEPDPSTPRAAATSTGDAAQATAVARRTTAENPPDVVDGNGALRTEGGTFPPGVDGGQFRDPGNATPGATTTDNRS
jgi:hypothetical protein